MPLSNCGACSAGRNIIVQGFWSRLNFIKPVGTAFPGATGLLFLVEIVGGLIPPYNLPVKTLSAGPAI